MKALRKELHLAALTQPSPNPHIPERLQQDAPTLHALRTLARTSGEMVPCQNPPPSTPENFLGLSKYLRGGSLGIKNHSAMQDRT